MKFDTVIFIQENAFEQVVWKMLNKFSLSQFVKVSLQSKELLRPIW